jgi:hypothetical protein
MTPLFRNQRYAYVCGGAAVILCLFWLWACSRGNAQPRQCPFNHKDLAWLRVVHAPRAVVRDKQGRLMSWYGSRFDPDKRLVCLQCEYAFDEQHNLWERHSNDLNDFLAPASPEFLAATTVLRNMAGTSNSPSYMQKMGLDRVILERGNTWSMVDGSNAVRDVAECLRGQRIEFSEKRSEWGGHQYWYLTATSAVGSTKVTVHQLPSGRNPPTCINVTMTHFQDIPELNLSKMVWLPAPVWQP